MLDGNAETADLLRGNDGAKRSARIIDCILRELGHASALAGDDSQSETFKKTSKSIHRLRGETA